mgnify:CR=1 FL=1
MQDSSAAGTIVVNKTKYFACAEPLTLYDRNAPFSNEHWLLLGIVPNSTLYKISNDMQSLLLVAVVLTLGVGLVCSYLVSRGLAHPIRQLSDEVAAIQDKRTEIPKALAHRHPRDRRLFHRNHPAQSGYSGYLHEIPAYYGHGKY